MVREAWLSGPERGQALLAPGWTPAGHRGTPCWSQAGDQVPYGPSSALVVVVELCISGPGVTWFRAGSDLEEHLRTFLV